MRLEYESKDKPADYDLESLRILRDTPEYEGWGIVMGISFGVGIACLLISGLIAWANIAFEIMYAPEDIDAAHATLLGVAGPAFILGIIAYFKRD